MQDEVTISSAMIAVATAIWALIRVLQESRARDRQNRVIRRRLDKCEVHHKECQEELDKLKARQTKSEESSNGKKDT